MASRVLGDVRMSRAQAKLKPMTIETADGHKPVILMPGAGRAYPMGRTIGLLAGYQWIDPPRGASLLVPRGES